MNPATPKAERPPATQLRKTVSGDSHRHLKTTSLLAGLMRRIIPVLVSGWTVTVLAQPGNTLVVPNALANMEGNVGNVYPFNFGTNSMRYQQVYAASQFGAMPAGGAFITGIAFRADAGWGGFSTNLSAVQINFSTTAKAPDELSATFADNPGPDDMVAFNGPLTLSSAAAGNPRAFDIVIPLTTPYFYNPAAGNLLLDVRNAGGGLTTQFDAVSVNGDSVSRTAGAPVTASSGNTPDSLGLVTKFIFVSIGQATLSAPTFTNNQFQVTVGQVSNLTYVIQGNTNLSTTNWLALATNVAPFTFTDSGASNHPMRFYRALYQP